MSDQEEVEIRFEPRPRNRVRVSARWGTHTIARTFEGASYEAEVFLWLADHVLKTNGSFDPERSVLRQKQDLEAAKPPIASLPSG